jgi:hypothetical protein
LASNQSTNGDTATAWQSFYLPSFESLLSCAATCATTATGLGGKVVHLVIFIGPWLLEFSADEPQLGCSEIGSSEASSPSFGPGTGGADIILLSSSVVLRRHIVIAIVMNFFLSFEEEKLIVVCARPYLKYMRYKKC